MADYDLETGEQGFSPRDVSSALSSTFDDDDVTTTHDGDEDDDMTINTAFRPDNKALSPRQRQLAAEEIQTVKRVKFFVMISLVLITIAVAVSAYFMSYQREDDEFVKQYHEDAQKLMKTVGDNLILTLQSADAFTVSMASLAVATNQTWPFVVIPDFAVNAEKIRSLASAVLVNIYALVEDDQREEWENFTAATGKGWVDESIRAIENYDAVDYWDVVWNYTLYDVIHTTDEYDKANPGVHGTNRSGPYLPMWQTQPTIAYDPPYNWDLMGHPTTTTMNKTSMETVLESRQAVITESYMVSYEDDLERQQEDQYTAEWISDYIPEDEVAYEPAADIYYPIIPSASENIELFDEETGEPKADDGNRVAGLFSVTFYWRDQLRNILPEGTRGMFVVFHNPCNPSFTYQVDGADTTYLGVGDLHDANFDEYMYERDLQHFRQSDSAVADHLSAYSGVLLNEEFCPYSFRVYPSESMREEHMTLVPVYFSLVTIVIFAITCLTFVVYDYWVERRQKVVMKTAVTTTKLVSELFPDVVMDKVLPSSDHSVSYSDSQPKRLKSFLTDSKTEGTAESSDETNKDQNNKTGGRSGRMNAPIAELFPETTVFFADIAGFTSWSSEREPAAVFTLLESIYGAFDKIAKKFNVFKIETIGDSYLAVCGLPEPSKNHAVLMGRFAMECLKKMKEKVRELELTLGPGTADLDLRVGLHSGPTIAGVLRGEKARFQLFGDTVNTAARMESTGIPNKIQVSQKTADLFVEAGKESWLIKREDLVNAKGKGTLQTYWLSRKLGRSSRRGSATGASQYASVSDGNSLFNSAIAEQPKEESSELSDAPANAVLEPKIQRLINWNVAIIQELLEEIAAQRIATEKSDSKISENIASRGQHIRDDVVESINMPSYNAYATAPLGSFKASSHNKLDPRAIVQLREYITKIATFYHSDNGFHNFAHASHVIMSTIKLLQRIATPDVKKKECENEQEFFKYTYGISSDPLTKLGIVWSALVHDVDHQGVSNFQLAKEKDSMAVAYDNKSVLEQHSLDLSWSLLMEPSFKELRKAIYATQEEYNRFRQLTINCVMATDIFDKELKSFRDGRWEKAFKLEGNDREGHGDNCDDDADWERKATIVIECIIQASDVAHTMQHWHVYQRWNKCLFTEMYAAYKAGRAEKDPSLSWYEGELWFFDNYIIPLASKLRECQVFGVSCDEFLDFATENRKEWEVKGRDIVAQMVEDVAGSYNSGTHDEDSL